MTTDEVKAALFLAGGMGVVGVVLYRPFLLWFRHRRRRDRAITVVTQVTGAGLVFYAMQVVALFAGFAVGELAPQSLPGAMMKGLVGRVAWALFVLAVSGLILKRLQARGFVVLRRMVRLPIVEPRRLADRASSATEAAARTPDELRCALAVLSSEPVRKLYEALGSDVAAVAARVAALPRQPANPRFDRLLDASVQQPLQAPGMAPPVALEVRLLAGLASVGSDAARQALAPDGGLPGDIPFFVARGRPESELRSAWPAPADRSGRVMLLDDAFTPMDAVVAALQDSFGLAYEAARATMLEAHAAGAAVLAAPGATDAGETCLRLNREWRAAGMALYCEPERSRPVSAGERPLAPDERLAIGQEIARRAAEGEHGEPVNETAMPARAAQRRPLVSANARHGHCNKSHLRLDRTPLDDPLGHAGFIHRF